MFAFGMGGNRRYRSIRFGAIALIVLAGIVLHHSGPLYDALRFAYLAVILGFVIMAARSRRANGFGRPETRGADHLATGDGSSSVHSASSLFPGQPNVDLTNEQYPPPRREQDQPPGGTSSASF